MKTQLSKRWYIERTADTASSINEWFNDGSRSYYHLNFGFMGYPNLINFKGFFRDSHDSTEKIFLKNGYKKITFEEFEAWVLNKLAITRHTEILIFN